MATIEFVPLKDFENDYEILSQYPFTIRKKRNHYEVKEFKNHYGYPSVALNGDNKLKHRLIAKQFIPNDDPDNKVEVDHKNKRRDDYHLENLRWVSRTENQINKTSHLGNIYEYVDDIPDDAIVVDSYGVHKFENYYYHDNVFYFYNGIQYRKLHIIEYKNGSKCVHMTDSNGENIGVYYNKFKKQYDLL